MDTASDSTILSHTNDTRDKKMPWSVSCRTGARVRVSMVGDIEGPLEVLGEAGEWEASLDAV